ncbi:Gfo/Idh/MocA family protein [Microbacterium murale]|uniref:1,5-anhydro-D-fructose reductase (1,5-anhydro-D-mannitol-forming) n=1 Tax=Microbacterium murale TaxID=1081040 RepID=A0ABU0P842_9MICO|nr:Gfo/Idh/MocA family oxidoreductase [Microbacterium murale]MDQ0643122.1 1,5-anhydro-D-fructose reductase (1,5-anhydro-D-mannitol-forming) [Microbacterium murale]
MTDTIGVGVAGFWHVHADDYAREVSEHPGTRLVAMWDEDRDRGSDGAKRWGKGQTDSLDALLARPDVDAITVTTATNEHTDVIERAIAAGKHVFTEKLLAPTVSESEELVAAARANGVALVVSLPRLSEPLITTASGLIDDGALGDVTYARVRMAHDGWLGGWLPERFADPIAALGGAFADLGCHPAYLVQRFLGARPSTIVASYGNVTDRAVEDNAVVVARYADGALGVAEASFVTTPGAFALELRGTEASLLFGFGREELIGKGGRFGDDWTPVPLDSGAATPFDLWVDAIRGGADTSDNHQAAIDLTRFVVAANAAAASGTAVVEQKGHA